MTDVPDLLACPFCGGDAIRRSEDEAGNRWASCYLCDACAYETEWNRRTPAVTTSTADVQVTSAASTPSSDVVERLREYAGWASHSVRRDLLNGAADEITRLRSGRDAVIEECAKVVDQHYKNAVGSREAIALLDASRAIRTLSAPSTGTESDAAGSKT